MSTASLTVALKEWAIVTDFLAQGKCALLLRKGGIHEDEGPGRFHLEHDAFALFPAWEHERLDWIKPAWLPERAQLKLADGHLAVPETLEFKGWAQVAKVWKIPSRAAFDSLDDLHPWAKPHPLLLDPEINGIALKTSLNQRPRSWMAPDTRSGNLPVEDPRPVLGRKVAPTRVCGKRRKSPISERAEVVQRLLFRIARYVLAPTFG